MGALRDRFPGASITYVVEPHAAAIVQGNADIDDVLVAPRERGLRGLTADIALGRALRARRFDLAIDFHGGPRASLLTWLSASPTRVGYEILGRSWMYTHRVSRPRALRARHSVENQWDLLTAIGFDAPDRTRNRVEMPLDPRAAATVAARLTDAGVIRQHRLAVVHVSAGNPFRRWPLEHFVAVVSALAHGQDHRIVVTSGPSETEAAARVVADARATLGAVEGSRVLACGEFSLVELRALLERAHLYVGGDSGPLHIAATTNVPVVALFGPTLPARSMPWRDPRLPMIAVDAGELPCRPCDQRRCAPGDFRCLTRIPPERVVEAALRWLDG
ncbi:MAG TPA: glycosyltransferase family 9 protein [Vicinamibacterales bacterium]